MQITNRLNCLIITALVLICNIADGQITQKYRSPKHEFTTAEELFQMEQYSSAKNLFKQVYEQIDDQFDTKKQSSLYHMAVCAAILYHDDAPELAYYFAETYPEYMGLERIWYYLGNYYFTKKQYKKALEEYKKVSYKSLNEEELAAAKFKMGYGYFLQEDYQTAKELFVEVMQTENEYKNKATFYYSHILYTEQSYTSALKGFEQLKNEETYSEIVPFYIAHIYFSTGKYAEVIAQKDELISKSSSKRLPEINALIAQSYFQLQQYQEAIPYFDTYMNSNPNVVNCEFYYMNGYCHYRTGNYQKAIDLLTGNMCKDDSISQYAYFTLGDCYLQTNNKEFASRAFLLAHEKGGNQQIKEDALFNYAKLQYELSSNPFVGAISSFEKYLNEYPNSTRRDEVESYLSTIYLTTKNYKAAIKSLEKIKNKNTTLLKAYQRVSYYRALECFNENNLDEADHHLDVALLNNYDATIYAQSLFWKAEISYQRENYTQAEKDYQLFFASSKANQVAEYPMAFYNAGYASFKLKKYNTALNKFNEFITRSNNIGDTRIIADAYNRIGDCHFMLSNLEAARSNYQKVIDMNVYDVDYALFQRAQSEGGLRMYDTKNQTMQTLVSSYPNSNYVTDAQYEIANTYFVAGKYNQALDSYNRFIENNPKNPLVKSALLKMGSIYYNNEQDAKALATYKKLINEYPNSEEASTALKSIENIYVASGNVDDFFAYVRSISSEKITNGYQDSLTYNAASEKYFNKNFVEAEKGFSQYIKRFPAGIFAIKANYYKAECAMLRNDYATALPCYEFVIKNNGEATFLYPSLQQAANITYKDSNYQQALNYYTQLSNVSTLASQKTEGNFGKMRCQYHLKQYRNAIATANIILQDSKNDVLQTEEARLTIARSAMAMDSMSLAKTQYNILAKTSKTEAASEALYQLAYIEYLQGDYDKTEKQIFDMLVNINHDYWLAKSYILLGDTYLKKGNSFQAKYTYLSIMENYDGADLVKEATEKYNAIIAQEEAANQTKEQQEDESEN